MVNVSSAEDPLLMELITWKSEQMMEKVFKKGSKIFSLIQNVSWLKKKLLRFKSFQLTHCDLQIIRLKPE